MLELSLTRVIILATVIALVIVLGGGIALNANTSDTETIRVAMDQDGNMRLLSPEVNGSLKTELRSNEFIIEILSRESVISLQEMLTNLQQKVSELESKVSAIDFYNGWRYCTTGRTLNYLLERVEERYRTWSLPF